MLFGVQFPVAVAVMLFVKFCNDVFGGLGWVAARAGVVHMSTVEGCLVAWDDVVSLEVVLDNVCQVPLILFPIARPRISLHVCPSNVFVKGLIEQIGYIRSVQIVCVDVVCPCILECDRDRVMRVHVCEVGYNIQ